MARSDEAKRLGIRMGDPWFKLRHLEESSGLIALSSNFELYGDISDRMMSVAAGIGPEQEIYSIDEAFHSLHGVRGDLKERAWRVRDRIRQWVGIPCCVGIGATKTLAKLANHIAKKSEAQGLYPREHAVVCDLSTIGAKDIEQLLESTPVEDIWGVGRRISANLHESGIHTALDLAHMEPATVKRSWSVVLERTVRELRGLPCISLADQPDPRKQIAVTRSFGAPVLAIDQLSEAVTEFAATAGLKLRRQSSLATQVLVFARTSPFRSGPQYSRSIIVPLRRPSADSTVLVGAALLGLKAIYRRGFEYTKAGVMLLDLLPVSRHQYELDLEPERQARDQSRLMAAMDAVNGRWGNGTLRISSGKIGRTPREWPVRSERRTPRYTTRWEEIPVVRA